MAEDDVKIVMFCCNWCSYGGADTAGTARMQYPPNVRVIRVMCSEGLNPNSYSRPSEKALMGSLWPAVTMETATTTQETTNSTEE